MLIQRLLTRITSNLLIERIIQMLVWAWSLIRWWRGIMTAGGSRISIILKWTLLIPMHYFSSRHRTLILSLLELNLFLEILRIIWVAVPCWSSNKSIPCSYLIRINEATSFWSWMRMIIIMQLMKRVGIFSINQYWIFNTSRPILNEIFWGTHRNLLRTLEFLIWLFHHQVSRNHFSRIRIVLELIL